MAILDELKAYNFNFNKKFGQNFIFDTNLLRSIVACAGIDNQSQVLEIGTGAGTLTDVISDTAKYVVSYEIDTNLQPYLTNKFASKPNVKLVFGDIMLQTMADIEANFNGNYSMIANLPYYITTPIIFKFLDNATKLQSLTIMVQLEVAERLVAKENTANYGAITAAIATMGNARIVKRISRHMFTPAPNVDSAIVRIDIVPNKYDVVDQSILRRTIRAAFAMRRKTLANNLKSSFGFDSDTTTNILSISGLPQGIRGEALSAAQLVTLSNVITEYCFSNNKDQKIH